MEKNSPEILFDKFEIVNCLKKDINTSVYLANHIYLGKKIILKTLNTKDLADISILERFKREAKILAKLDHPNLIKVLDFGTAGDFFYISFEYFESKNLREVIKQNNLSIEDKTDLIIQLLKALNIAHQNYVIHRDIKPENILVNSKHELKIADFGLALVINDTVLTQNSSIVGTPSYMAPEQIRGEKTQQTDLFSTGIVAYELFTGKNPFIGKGVSETINNILDYDEEELFNKISLLPESIQPALKGMLRKNLKQRTITAIEVLKLLGVEGEVYKPIKRSPAINPKYNKYLIYASGFLVIALIVVGLWLWKINSSSHTILQGKSKIDSVKSTIADQQSPDTLKSKDDPVGADISKKNVNKVSPSLTTIEKKSGKLFVECSPWAYIFVDGDSIDMTPLQHPINLKPGKHKLKLVYKGFPAYEKNLYISSGKTDSIKINFMELVGYLNCNVDPWGKIYLDGNYEGTTPLKPIALLPGTYDLKIVSDSIYKIINKKIVIKSKQSNDFNFHMEPLSQE
jgi:eukaryotic-like serine/threonine-protein kinase